MSLTPLQESQGGSELTIVKLLQQHIAKLQGEQSLKPRILQVPLTVQVIYRVHCFKRKVTKSFLDILLEFHNSPGQKSHLQGRRPAAVARRNTRGRVKYTTTNSSRPFCFTAYKELICCKPLPIENNRGESWGKDEPPINRETIRITSQVLADAFASLRNGFPDIAKHFPDLGLYDEIYSPFVFYYQKRVFFDKLDSLPPKHLRQICIFRDYIENIFGAEFDRVDNLVREGMITVHYMLYLFQPGEVILFRSGDDYLG